MRPPQSASYVTVVQDRPAVNPPQVLAVLQESLAQPPAVLPAVLKLRQQTLKYLLIASPEFS